MGRFFFGFAVATALWGGLFAGYDAGLFDEWLAPEELEPIAAAPEEEETEVEEEAPQRRRGRRGRRRRGNSSASETGMDYPRGEATTGDDLGENDPREISAGTNGGEAQLSNAQVEAVFDRSFGGIQRCLVLVPPDAPLRGRLTFGLRIAGSGRVTRVNLRGPAAVTQGEAGSCLRRAAQGLSFPSFEGPEMLVHYPVTLE